MRDNRNINGILSIHQGERMVETQIPADEGSGGSKAWPEFVLAYYEHQYDRIARLEEQRLTISNIVTTTSGALLTLSFLGSQAGGSLAHIGVAVIVLALNLFAVTYTFRSIGYIRGHRLRAKRVLDKHATDLAAIDKAVSLPEGGPWGRWRIQVYLHAVLAVIAVIYAFIA